LFELQEELAEMSERTISLNNLQSNFKVVQGKLQEADVGFNGTFSLVLCNPPYKKANSGEQNLKREVAICRHEVEICQREIIATAYRLLKQGGRFCMCQRIERLPETFKDLAECKFNVSRLQLVVNKASNKPYLFLIEGYKTTNRQFFVLDNYIN
jgi:tRNA1(Val) A37 N6-methylase TrmN6